MVLKINRQFYKDVFIFLLPTLIIVSQFITIGTIRLSWALSLFMAVLVFSRLSYKPERNVLIITFIIVLLYPIISFFWSFSGSFDINLYLSLVTGAVFLLYINVISEERIHDLIDGCFFSCAIFVIMGIYEIFTGKYYLFSNEDFILRLNSSGLHYPGVAFANTNDLAQFLAIVLPIVIAYVWKEKGKKTKLFLSAILIGAIFVIYQSYCHLAMISLIISLWFIITRYTRNYLSVSKRLAFYFLLALIIFLLVKYTDVITLIYNNLIKVETTNIHYVERASIYSGLFESFIRNPLGGFGNAYATATISPHNLFLYIISDFGIIVGLVFVYLLIRIVVNLLKKINDPVCLGLFATFIAFPLSSCISSGNEQRKVVWLILGLGIRYAWKKANNSESSISVQYSKEGIEGVSASADASSRYI